MIPEAHVVHKVNDRLRIKIPSKRGEKDFFASVEKKFSKDSAGQTVVVNPDTASVLFLGRFTARHIAEVAQQSELFKLETKTRRRETLLGGVKDMFRIADRRLLKITGGELDIPECSFSWVDKSWHLSIRAWEFHWSTMVHGVLVCSRPIFQIQADRL